MPYLIFLSLAHLALLVWLSRSTARSLFTAGLPRLLALAVLVWANLVLTALAVSPLRLLDSPPAYFATSVGLALATRWFFARACSTVTVSSEPSFAELARRIRADGFSLLLAIVLLAITLGVVLIAVSVLPNNWDTLAYRFPRAHFFRSSGALVHAGEGIDPRINFYPYNGTLLYLFLAQYQWPPLAWNFVGVGGWLLCGAAGLHLALQMSSSIRAAMISLHVVLTTPIVLALANSTNDELLASAPLVTALSLGLFAYRQRSPQAGLLALIAAGVGAGVKLHWLWLVPWLAAGVAIVARREGGEILRRARGQLRPAAVAGVIVVSLLLAGSFLIGNYRATGRIQVIPRDFAAGIVNRPFHLGAALQTTGLYTIQLLGAPLVDHFRVAGASLGGRAYELANEYSMRWLGPWVRQGPPYTHVNYRFGGLVAPDAAVFYEGSLWLGLLPHVALVALAGLLWRRPAGYALPAFLLAALPAWHVTHSFMVRYAETTGTYYAFAAPFFAAPIGWLWERARRSRFGSARAIAIAIVVLLASHTLLAGTLLLANQRRSVQHAFAADRGEIGTTRVSPQMRVLLAEARRVEIPYTHWELLYWNIMRLNPEASYSTGGHRGAADLTLYALSRRLEENHALRLLPVRFEGPGTARRVGGMNGNSDVVFCSGPTCRRACANCEGYLLLPLRVERDEGRATIRVGEESSPGRTPFARSTAALRIVREKAPLADWISIRDLWGQPLVIAGVPPGPLVAEVSSGPGGVGVVRRTRLHLGEGGLVLEVR